MATYPLVRVVGTLGFSSRSTRIGRAFACSFAGPIFIAASKTPSTEGFYLRVLLPTLVQYWRADFLALEDDW